MFMEKDTRNCYRIFLLAYIHELKKNKICYIVVDSVFTLSTTFLLGSKTV